MRFYLKYSSTSSSRLCIVLSSRWAVETHTTCSISSSLGPNTITALKSALISSTDANVYIRDVTRTSACNSEDIVINNINMQIQIGGDCFTHVHRNFLSVYDFSGWWDLCLAIYMTLNRSLLTPPCFVIGFKIIQAANTILWNGQRGGTGMRVGILNSHWMAIQREKFQSIQWVDGIIMQSLPTLSTSQDLVTLLTTGIWAMTWKQMLLPSTLVPYQTRCLKEALLSADQLEKVR